MLLVVFATWDMVDPTVLCVSFGLVLLQQLWTVIYSFIICYYPVLCPKGDDPLTTGQVNRAITFTTSASSGTLAGSIRFTFNG